MKEVCGEIIKTIGPIHLKTPKTTNEWINIAREFEEKWSFPNVLGCIDGKHVNILKPPNSGSLFRNYKGWFSIVLLAVCDANYKLIYVDVGSNGAQSDGGIWQRCSLRNELNNLNVPKLNESNGLNYCFLGDQGFPLQSFLMRPFPRIGSITEEQEQFNNSLSVARRTIENVFGIMAMKFRILLNKMLVNVENSKLITLSVCILHNVLINSNSTRRNYINSNTDRPVQLLQIEPTQSRNAPHQAKLVRQKFVDYFRRR